jgi:hypothetical protein
MKTFSVLTVSKRTGWELLASNSIDAQTEWAKEWIIVAEELPKTPKDYLKTDGKIMTRWVKAPPKLRLSNLNASLNAGLRKIDTDYVIFYQDFIKLPPDCFEKLLDLADERTLVTTCTPNYDGSDDGRYTGVDRPRSCRPEEWETNVAIAPMKVLYALGGFDEEYDNGWSWDNVNVAQRAAMLGCKFLLDESNRPQLLPHEQKDKETLPLNMERHRRTIRDIRSGQKPLKLTYLQNGNTKTNKGSRG